MGERCKCSSRCLNENYEGLLWAFGVWGLVGAVTGGCGCLLITLSGALKYCDCVPFTLLPFLSLILNYFSFSFLFF